MGSTFVAMTPRITRLLTVTTATALVATGLGCGLIGAAKNLVATASILADFGERLGKSAKLTYRAEYSVNGGDKVTFVQQPPDAAYFGRTGSYIFTKDYIYLCDVVKGRTACDRMPNSTTSVTAR